MYRVLLALILAIFALPLSPKHANAIEVYFFRGAGDFSFISNGMQYSRGLDRMAEQLNSEGIHADVYRYSGALNTLNDIRRRKPERVAFVGHSMGAFTAMRMARKMEEEGVRVAYVATLDIPKSSATVSDNVEWAENFHSLSPRWGKLDNVDTHPRARNISVDASHTTLDDSATVRDNVLAAIRDLAASNHKTIESIITADLMQPVMWGPFDELDLSHATSLANK